MAPSTVVSGYWASVFCASFSHATAAGDIPFGIGGRRRLAALAPREALANFSPGARTNTGRVREAIYCPILTRIWTMNEPAAFGLLLGGVKVTTPVLWLMVAPGGPPRR